jgi:thioredoxin-dependent peroxiredoxin
MRAKLWLGWLALMGAAVLAWGKDKDSPKAAPPAPEPGQQAPAFILPATTGKASLKDFKGKYLVLVFYPKAFAPRDSKEMNDLKEVYASLKAMNAEVLGVSMDPLNVAVEFHDKLSLPFALASDSEKTASAHYGVLGLGELFSARKTFIIDPQGRIAVELDKIKDKNHGAQVLQAIKTLQASPAP